MTGPMIRAEEVSVQINHSVILDEVGFTLREAQFLTIIGPNGAGKSTLLKVIDGLIYPTGGKVEIAGRSLEEYDRRALARTVSFVPQGDPGGFGFTVRSFVEMGRYSYLKPWAPLSPDDRLAVKLAMKTTEVTHLADRFLGSLSGGERQRTLIAAALAQGGRVLLLDEPTSFLDYRHQVQVLELLEQLHSEKGYTIVVVTHDLNSTVPLSDLVLALKAGRVAFAGPPKELMDIAVLEEIFGGSFRLVDDGTHQLVVPSSSHAERIRK
ncbi:MAG: ABC transporter ATP-binding protein [Thermoanaerobaculales bacterium]|nr:ABC transporter ATP-binding protein [Thermoanaerobaculales bacterium]